MKVKRGFTLIELLVVIMIIAIMAAILYPVFAKARAQAEFATCQENLKRLGVATLMYAEDNAGEMPPLPERHFGAISKYSGGYDAVDCPTAHRTTPGTFNGYGVNVYLDSVKRLAGDPKNTVMLADSPHRSIASQTDISRRHSGTANIAFADGHVKAYSSFDKFDFEPVYKSGQKGVAKKLRLERHFKRGDICPSPTDQKP